MRTAVHRHNHSLRQRIWRALGALILVCVTLPIVVFGFPATALSTPIPTYSTSDTPISQPPTHATHTARTVVVVGTANLTWDHLVQAEHSSLPEVSSSATGIMTLAGSAYPVSLVTRTTHALTCPADGWLTLGAGQRLNASDGTHCTTELDWQRIDHHAETQHYQATPGRLSSDLIDTQQARVITVGTHAWLAGDQSSSTIHAESISQAAHQRASWKESPALILIDAAPASCSHDGSCAEHSDDVIIDAWAAISQVTSYFSDYPLDLVVASLSDAGHPSPQLGILPPAMGAMAATHQQSAPSLGSPDFIGPGTHQAGLVQTRSLATLITSVMNEETDFVTTAAPACPSPHTPHCDPTSLGRHAAERLRDDDIHAQASHRVTLPIAISLIVCTLLTTAISAALVRGWHPQVRALALTALTAAGIPLALALGNLVPWWRIAVNDSTPPTWLPAALIAGVIALCALVAAIVVTVVAQFSRHESRTWQVITMVLASAISCVVFVVPVVNQRLALNGPLGMNSIIAGRFFGVSNPAFAVGSGALVVALTSWSLAAPKHSRWVHALALGGTGFTVMALDAMPSIGADIGGALALGIVVCVLVIRTLRWSLTARRLIGAAATVFALVTAFALYDAARPTESQSHAGQFITHLNDGQSLSTIVRKLRALAGPLVDYSWIGPTIALIVVISGVLAWRKIRILLTLSAKHSGSYPLLALTNNGKTYLLTSALMVISEVLLNDSGLLMVGYAASTIVPLLLLILASHLAHSSPHTLGAQDE